MRALPGFVGGHMKIDTTRLPSLLLGLTLVVLLFVIAPRHAAADTTGIYDSTWIDDFETYQACPANCYDFPADQNTDLYFPAPPWTHSGLKDSFVYTDRPRRDAQALKAHGLNHTYGASIAYRSIGGYPPFEIDFWAMSIGDENLLPTAGFLKTVGVELGTGPTFTSNHRGLLSFTVEDLYPIGAPDGQEREIWGGYLETDETHLDGVYLGLWQGDTYHHINIKYEPVPGDNTKVQITWTIDGGAPVSRTYDVNWYENQLDYVGLWAAGGQVWFDDVRVTSSTDVFNFDTPDAPHLTEKVYLPAILR
jgi:hypothetical protein